MSETLVELICHENTYKDITCNRDFFGKNWDKFFAKKELIIEKLRAVQNLCGWLGLVVY